MNEPTIDDHRRTRRLINCARLALEQLPSEDADDRREWCVRTGAHGLVVRPIRAENRVEIDWGGRLLAELPISMLDSDEPIEPPQIVNGDVPDSVPADWHT